MMIATGAELPKISRHLGHANIAITSAIYGHQLQERTPEALGAMLEGRLEPRGRLGWLRIGCEFQF